MDSLSPTLWLCTAILVAAACALTARALMQHSRSGFGWWTGALWLNAAAAGLIAGLGPGHAALPVLQLAFVPWPLLCLLGLRRFHARIALPCSARVDMLLLCLLLATAGLAPHLVGDAALSIPMSQAAACAALLYAALVVAGTARSQDTAGLRSLGALWLTAALAPPLGTEWGQAGHSVALQASVVALASLLMAFIVLAMSSRRTEHQLRQSRRRLRVLANIDMLTQVPNRRRFEELARRALQADEDGSAALLLVDIDHFKQINDKLGHAAGDRALKLVSRCTLELLRSQDVAGRHGGDEFVMLLRRSSTQDAMQVAERLVAHLQQQAHAHALPRLSLSFGIVQMRRGESIDDTLHRADLALYEAKRLGRSRAVSADGDAEQPVFHSSQRLGLTSS